MWADFWGLGLRESRRLTATATCEFGCRHGVFGADFLTFLQDPRERRKFRDAPVTREHHLFVEVGKRQILTSFTKQKEMWTETPVHNGKKGRPVNKDRFISKM